MPQAMMPGGVGQPQMMWYPAQPPGYGPYAAGGNGVAPAGYYAPPPYVEVAPGVYREAGGPPNGAPPAGMPTSETGGEYEADPNCPNGPDSYKQYHNPFAFLLPYSDHCRSQPRWFDISMEAVFLKRDKASNDTVPFASLGFNLPPPGGAIPPPNIVLSSDNLKFDEKPGMRVTGVHQVGPGSDIEISYLGLFHWASAAAVNGSQFSSVDPNNLWSPFSNFGTNPPGFIAGIGFPGYDDVDHAYFSGISLATEVNTVEIDYRRRWAGPHGLFQGSWLAGFRYFQLRDNFLYQTRTNNMDAAGNPGFMDYTVVTVNNMYGGQLGGDLWACLLPGFDVGVESKGGIYGNDAQQASTIFANSIPGGQFESKQKTEIAFQYELSLLATYRLSPKFTLRGGYMMMWADGLALGTDNFNAAPPQAFQSRTPISKPSRVVTIDDSGNLFWSGWTAGAEYMW